MILTNNTNEQYGNDLLLIVIIDFTRAYIFFFLRVNFITLESRKINQLPFNFPRNQWCLLPYIYRVL